MYDFNPAFVALSSFTPHAGSLAASAATLDGTVCAWVNETSGVTIDVSIAQPDRATFDALAASASAGTPVDVGDEAYFAIIDGEGTTQVFTGRYWLTLASVYFSSPFDALDIVEVAVRSLR